MPYRRRRPTRCWASSSRIRTSRFGCAPPSALGYVGKGGGHFDALVALFKDADAPGMQGVLYAMGRSRDRRFLPYLRDALKQPNLSVRQTAAFELTMYPAGDVHDDLAALLKDPEPVMRAAAVSALGQLGDEADTPRMREMLDDPSELVRRGRRRRSATGRGPETVAALAARLTDAAPSVRAAVAEALGQMKATAQRGAVEKLLDDTDVVVRRYRSSAGRSGRRDRTSRPGGEVEGRRLHGAVLRAGVADGVGR